MELLSPAGNLINAYSAFKGGADAVYIGGKRFSARASADNFTNEEIKEITFFAHSIGRKVYVTLNTLLFQDEFFQAVEFAKFLYSINIDGIIIQDLGLAHYLHETMPDLPLNASTQLNCHNIQQAKTLIKIGFKRIVLAREVSLETAKQIKALGVEVEMFGHGALCVSYSGNCLMSSFIGNRSGNRGKCAQPCRMRYNLLENKEVIEQSTFAISTKDLMTIDSIKEIIDAGIDSLKIEGRLKSNEYIYAVSRAYRHAIDSDQDVNTKEINEDKDRLTKIFNREFTKGFILNESPFKTLNMKNSSHIGEPIGKVTRINKTRVSIKLSGTLHRLDGIRFNSKDQIGLTVEKMFLNGNPVEVAYKDQIIEIIGIERAEKLMNLEVIKTKDSYLIKEIESELKNQIVVPLKGKIYAYPNSNVTLTVSLGDYSVTVKGDKASEATGNGTTEDRIIEQLKKCGSYPYSIQDLMIKMDRCYIPISLLNDLRNRAYETLFNTINQVRDIEVNEYENETFDYELTSKTSIFVENNTQYSALEEENFDIFSSNGLVNKNNNRICKDVDFKYPNQVVHFAIENESDKNLIASMYTSITNSYALDLFYKLGFNQCVLSLELNKDSIQAMINDYQERHNKLPNVGLLIYGKIDMMIMKSCPIGTHFNNAGIHCNRCRQNRYELVDRIGERYHLIGDSNCNIRVLANQQIYLFDRIKEIRTMGVNNFWLLFTDEGEEKIKEVLANYKNRSESFNRIQYTRGHYNNRPE